MNKYTIIIASSIYRCVELFNYYKKLIPHYSIILFDKGFRGLEREVKEFYEYKNIPLIIVWRYDGYDMQILRKMISNSKIFKNAPYFTIGYHTGGKDIIDNNSNSITLTKLDALLNSNFRSYNINNILHE